MPLMADVTFHTLKSPTWSFYPCGYMTAAVLPGITASFHGEREESAENDVVAEKIQAV